jgi:hypothetical protein
MDERAGNLIEAGGERQLPALIPPPDERRTVGHRRSRRALGASEATLRLDAALELHAFEIVKASLAAHHEVLDDADLMLDLAEGQTSLLEALDCMLEADLNDEGLLEGLKRIKETVIGRIHRLEERRKSRRVILEQALLALERRSLERPVATMSLADRAPSVEVEDESAIPAKFFDLKPVLDKRLVKAALEAGEDVPGARLAAGLLTLTLRRR